MAQAKEITFTIKDGSFTMDLEGFHGKGCKEIAAKFDQLGTVVVEKVKREYNDPEPNNMNKLTNRA